MSKGESNNKKPSSLTKRILSGVVLGPLIIAVIFLGGWFFAFLMFASFLVSLYEFAGLIRARKGQTANLLLGTLYLSVCIGSFTYLRYSFDEGAWLALSAMICIWASDIGAYISGKTIGGPKMAPKLSPNKTWAGLGGAAFFCGLGLVVFIGAIEILLGKQLIDISYPAIFTAGLLLGLVGQAGDLFISFFKRRAGAKDTGHLIPGHGGLLDRIDSILLVSPAFLGFLVVCQ